MFCDFHIDKNTRIGLLQVNCPKKSTYLVKYKSIGGNNIVQRVCGTHKNSLISMEKRLKANGFDMELKIISL